MNAHEIPARFSRTLGLYGPEGFARVRAARVIVVGLGGVGTHAALALARSGVGGLRLVDFDVVTTSSLNRHPCAADDDVGRPKTEVLAAFLRRTCPDTSIETDEALWNADTAGALLDPVPDLVLDAVDDVDAKADIVERCVGDDIPVVVSMGAARRTDPGAVRTGPVAETRGCPLASRLRRRLRDRGVTSDVPCIWSQERPRELIRPAADVRDGIAPMPAGRLDDRKPMASGMSLPGILGYGAASLALARLTATSGPADA